MNANSLKHRQEVLSSTCEKTRRRRIITGSRNIWWEKSNALDIKIGYCHESIIFQIGFVH